MPDSFPRELGGDSSRLTFNFMHKGFAANVLKLITVSEGSGGVCQENAEQEQQMCKGSKGMSITPHT